MAGVTVLQLAEAAPNSLADASIDSCADPRAGNRLRKNLRKLRRNLAQVRQSTNGTS
jgi:hypothetical protein